MKIELLDFKELENYSSASGIEFYDDNIYLVGNEAKDLLVINKKWSKSSLEPLFDTAGGKNSNAVHSSLESMTLLQVDKKPHLLMLGSGKSPEESKGLLLNLKSSAKSWIDLSVFYGRLTAMGIPDLKIEGIALVYDYLVMVSRGSAAHPVNQLIVTRPHFWKQQEDIPVQLLDIDFVQPQLQLGVMGLSYSDRHEDLYLTVSTETTAAGADTGTIGKNYLGIIENLYRKIGREKNRIKINQLIDLSNADKQFKGYAIESVCIQSEKDHSIKLQMLATNSKGKNFLFKVYGAWES